jgi:hypothetical protein
MSAFPQPCVPALHDSPAAIADCGSADSLAPHTFTREPSPPDGKDVRHRQAARRQEDRMKFAVSVLALCVVLSPAFADAQDFGVMESAETIDKGNFKLRANPMFVFGDNSADDEPGIAGAFGYGFTDRMDAEFKVAFYDALTFIGGDAEFWLVKQPQSFNLSLSVGGHYANSDFSDHSGIDLTILGTHAVTSRLDIYGAVDMAFNRFREPLPDRTYTQFHLVPGVEYKLRPDFDLVAEVGIAVNDDSSHYFSGGIAYYLR